MRALKCLLVLPLAGLWSAGADAQVHDASRCLEEASPIDQIVCLAQAARDARDPAVCMIAEHEGVRWQCVAVAAEYLEDASLCRSIPTASEYFQDLRDVCLSDVAEVRGEPRLCEEIVTEGLRDSCYLKVVQGGASSELCSRILDPGLKSLCTGEPVYIE